MQTNTKPIASIEVEAKKNWNKQETKGSNLHFFDMECFGKEIVRRIQRWTYQSL